MLFPLLWLVLSQLQRLRAAASGLTSVPEGAGLHQRHAARHLPGSPSESGTGASAAGRQQGLTYASAAQRKPPTTEDRSTVSQHSQPPPPGLLRTPPAANLPPPPPRTSAPLQSSQTGLVSGAELRAAAESLCRAVEDPTAGALGSWLRALFALLRETIILPS